MFINLQFIGVSKTSGLASYIEISIFVGMMSEIRSFRGEKLIDQICRDLISDLGTTVLVFSVSKTHMLQGRRNPSSYWTDCIKVV